MEASLNMCSFIFDDVMMLGADPSLCLKLWRFALQQKVLTEVLTAFVVNSKSFAMMTPVSAWRC